RHRCLLACADSLHGRVRADRVARDRDQPRPCTGPTWAGHVPRPLAPAVPRGRRREPDPLTVVVKLGSSLVVGRGGHVRRGVLAGRGREIRRLVRRGERVCVGSSGAIALGLPRLGLDRRPRSISQLQAASALGQTRLQAAWDRALAPLHAAQVLLTAGDIGDRTTYVNARGALEALLRLGAVPVVNENDATATDEITFGDNDALAAQVAAVLRARLLVLLTEVAGVYSRTPGTPGAVLLEEGSRAGDAVLGAASPL